MYDRIILSSGVYVYHQLLTRGKLMVFGEAITTFQLFGFQAVRLRVSSRTEQTLYQSGVVILYDNQVEYLY